MSSPAKPRELTLRAICTGMIIGALLTPCNVYSGLKIGWSFNMSIAAALLSLAFWRLAEQLAGTRNWGLLENNINQTTASSAASIISGGLVAPIPALTLITGEQMDAIWMMAWVFAVSSLGIVVAICLRSTLLERQQLSFPVGIATAETVREIYARGAEASARIRALSLAGLSSAALKLTGELGELSLRWFPAIRWEPFGIKLGSAVSFKNLGIALDPSLLMVGFGMIIGWRTGLSLVIGAAIAWLALAPLALSQGWAQAAGTDDIWFGPLVQWLVWPGVSLMTSAALTTFLLHWARGAGRRQKTVGDRARISTAGIPIRLFVLGTALSLSLLICLQHFLHGLSLFEASLAILLAFVLATVAARVVGETGIPPIGALGKVSQFSFGIASPANVSSNLMGANVTGGAAGQCADLMNDLRTGSLLGATAKLQFLAQCFGVLTGSIVGVLAYRILIPDPTAMLLTAEWPAPAVATWKAVAEVFSTGWSALPPASTTAMTIAAISGVSLSLVESRLPASWRGQWPSATAMGLAFVIPAWISIGMFIGAAIAATLARSVPALAARYSLAIAAGLVAGESLAGIGTAMHQLLSA